MNLGMIQGGVARNVVPARCTVGMDVRYLPAAGHCQILDQVKTVIRRVENELPNARFEVNVHSVQEPIELSAHHPLVEAIQSETEAYLGHKPELMGMGGSTVAKMCNEAAWICSIWSKLRTVIWGRMKDAAFIFLVPPSAYLPNVAGAARPRPAGRPRWASNARRCQSEDRGAAARPLRCGCPA